MDGAPSAISSSIVIEDKAQAAQRKRDEAAKEAWVSTWSCTNAVDRTWIRKRLLETGEDVKLMFIEIELTDRALLKQHFGLLTSVKSVPLRSFLAAHAYRFATEGTHVTLRQ